MMRIVRTVMRLGVALAVVSILLLTLLVGAPQMLRRSLIAVGGPAATLAKSLIPPPLPEVELYGDVKWLDQGWDSAVRNEFHKTSQGTATLPVPYDWFMTLETPELRLISGPSLISEPDFLARLGFIPTKAIGPGETGTALPVGFAVLPAGIDPSTGEAHPVMLGFTCAACHTGAVRIGKQTLAFDGGPAMIDLGKLEQITGLSIIYTNALPWRASAFADRVLGRGPALAPEEKTARKRAILTMLDRLAGDMLNRIKAERSILDLRGEGHAVEGAGRLDALNRIGNQVFFENLVRAGEWASFDAAHDPRARNFAAISAPVSFPHIWNVSWFLWAQYDASIFNESIRNVGEALGVRALINMTSPASGLFRSSVRVKAIDELETMLSAKRDHPAFSPALGRFPGLRSPRWEEARKSLGLSEKDSTGDRALVSRGRELYVENCYECHRGPVADPEFEQKYGDLSLWKSTGQSAGERHVEWHEVGGRNYLNVVQKPVNVMGTDPAQSRILANRNVYLPSELGLDPAKELADACGAKARRNHSGEADAKVAATLDKCRIPLEGTASSAPFSLALMAVVARAENAWFAESKLSPAEAEAIRGPRPNMPNPASNRFFPFPGTDKAQLVSEPHYRARPLNGVWATAPFLHNGSVPTLMDLLLPQHKRTRQFCVGTRNFDPKTVGLGGVEPGRQEAVQCPPGEEVFDTDLPGNSRLGHSFEAEPTSDRRSWSGGIIGRKLKPDEREALIAYIKTL